MSFSKRLSDNVIVTNNVNLTLSSTEGHKVTNKNKASTVITIIEYSPMSVVGEDNRSSTDVVYVPPSSRTPRLPEIVRGTDSE